MQSFVLCGMFRSGSTFLSRALDANPEICCAMDPCAHFFKNVRNHFMKTHSNCAFDPAGPLEDNFFTDTPQVAEAIRNGTLDIPISKAELSDLRSGIVARGADFSPLLMPTISELEADTYLEAFTYILNSIRRCYGDENTRTTGFKVVWAEEFMPLLLNSIPDLKVIYLIRDPRAVIASDLAVEEGKYPYLFMVRQWRKSATYAILYSQLTEEYQSRVMLVRYEDVVDNFENICHNICKFLGVDFHPQMIDSRCYKAGDGEAWKPNSSYGEKQGVYKSSKKKWRTILDEKAQDYLQKLLQYEMKLLGYLDPATPYRPLAIADILNPPIVPRHTLAEWILQTSAASFSTNDFKLTLEMLKEDLRLRMLASEGRGEAWGRELIRGAFLAVKYYNFLQDCLSTSAAKGLF